MVTNKRTKEKYSEAKEFYKLDEESQGQKNYAEKILLENLVKDSFDSILEVGCGNGHFLENFPSHNKKGLELSQEMINNSGDNRKYIFQGDITDYSSFNGLDKEKFDRIVSHYVFTEIDKKGLERSFKNVRNMLNPSGKLVFTITDPRTRHLMEFDGYKLDFDNEEYDYNREDIPFTVLLRSEDQKYVDVGIRDFHNPIEVYDSLLKEAGFSDIQRTDIKRPQDKDNFAVMYEVGNNP
jgi:cyclopropane fatty-acyl-phospholipid synthase-like methyltransferase